MKYFEKRKLKKFLAHLEDKNFEWPEDYLEYHKKKIDMLFWLIASYEGRTASSPKELLESFLHPILKKDISIEEIKFLYYWVYYKRITGF